MIRLIFIQLLFLIGAKCFAQDAEFGFVFGANLYQRIDWDRAVYKAPDSYHTYVETQDGAGLLSKNSVINGVHFGLIGRYKYKRLTANLEPQYYYQRTYLSFEKPFFVERIIGKRAFRMPIYAAYKVFKNPKSPFLLAGFTLIKEQNWDFSAPGFDYYYGSSVSQGSLFDLGDDHFRGALYDNSFYWNYLVGFGLTFEKWQYSFRFQQKLDITKHKIEAKIFQVEMSFAIRLFSSSDLTKKHFLYVD